MTQTTKKNFDDMIEVEAVNMTRMGVFDSVNEGKEYLSGLFPASEEIKTTVRDPKSSGSGSGDPTPTSLATVDYAPLPVRLFDRSDGTNKAGPEIKDTDYPSMNLFDVVSKQGRTPVPRLYVGSGTEMDDGTVINQGQEKYMIPTRITNINGELFIVGKLQGQQRTKATNAQGDGRISLDGFDLSSQDEYQRFNELPDVIVPYEQNAGRAEGHFPGITKEFVLGKLGGLKPRKRGGAATVSGQASAEQKGDPQMPPGIDPKKWNALTSDQKKQVIEYKKNNPN